MFKKYKQIIISFILGALIFGGLPVMATSGMKTINAYYNDIKIMVDGKEVVSDAEPFIYDGRTYVPLRAIAEATDMEVELYNENKTINLTSNNVFVTKTTDGKYNIIGGNPEPLTEENSFKWGYLTIVFDNNTKKITNNNNVVLIDCKGNKLKVKCQPGTTAKDNFLIIPEKELEADTYYSLYIPKDSIVMENEDLYGEDILIYFKTANALQK